jgi:hypothetical protein
MIGPSGWETGMFNLRMTVVMSAASRAAMWRTVCADMARTEPVLYRRLKYRGGRKARAAYRRIYPVCRAEYQRRRHSYSAPLAYAWSAATEQKT